MDNMRNDQKEIKSELDEEIQKFAYLILDKILDDQENELRFFSNKQTH